MAFNRRIGLALSVAAWLCGCSVGPDYLAPEVPLPVLFGSASKTIVSQDTAPEPDMVRWWQTLHDPELNRLIEKAIACNPDLEIAITRVQAGRTQQIVVLGAALPQVEGSAGYAAGTGTDLTKGRAALPIRAGDASTGLQQITGIAGFDTGWELDLWGKYRRLLEAVRDDAQAFAEIRNAVLITVIADVARNYVDLRGLQLRLSITRNAVKAVQKTVEVVQARFDRGLTNELDLTLVKRELAAVQARIPLLVSAIAHAETQLAFLLGTYAADIIPAVRISPGLPRVPWRLRTGVPADLLRRRPDIRETERQLAGATARIGVSIANLFPTVDFTAGIGFQSGISSTSKSAATPISQPIWSAGPGGYWPLLDFGRLDALIDIQELQAHEFLLRYKKAIIFAVGEVDDAIKEFRAQQQRLRELAIALEQSRRAVRLSLERYDRGLTDFLNVLDAQRQEYDLEDQNAVA
ncbi:MAG: efflux transporter outer membrane subunit, partial [Rhodomicrobium sp.]